MKTLIIKILWAGILTLSAVGIYSNIKDSKIALSSENKINRSPAAEDVKTIVFSYNHKGKPLKLTFKGVTWETALKEGAHKCMDYYTEGKRAKVDEELYLDLIDVCVNPR